MVNRMRATRAHRDNRRSHHALDEARITRDTETGAVHLRHRVSMETGIYRGRKIFEVKVKGAKTAKTTKALAPAKK